MSENTKIEWCDATFNPWQGCEKVSPACKNCYAEAIVKRFGNDFAKRRRTSEANWKEPLKWDRWCRNNGVRKKVFSLSMGDWLDDEVPIEWLADFLDLIRLTPNLDWLLLTKRPQNWRLRMSEVVGWLKSLDWEEENRRHPGLWSFLFYNWLDGYRPPNIWIGTTVEDQARANERIPELLQIPARVRFLSCEPLLGSVDRGADHALSLGGSALPIEAPRPRFDRSAGDDSDRDPPLGIGINPFQPPLDGRAEAVVVRRLRKPGGYGCVVPIGVASR